MFASFFTKSALFPNTSFLIYVVNYNDFLQMETYCFPSCIGVKRRERKPRPAYLSSKIKKRRSYAHLLLSLVSAPRLSCALEQLVEMEEAGGMAIHH